MLILALPALAWDSIGAVWPAERFPLTYYLQGGLPDVTQAEAERAAEDSFGVWSDVECAGLAFTFGGWVDDAELGAADDRTVVFLVDQGWPDEASLVSSPHLTTDGATIVDGDVALNGVGYAWAVDGADGRTRMDVQASITHEIGHILGLWHSTASDATLNPSLDGNPEARDLATDDIDGLCALYAASTGAGEVGDACTTTTDCAEGLACLVDGEDRYCTSTCAAADDCLDGWTCLEVGGDSLCAQPVAEAGCGCAGAPGPAGALLVLSALLSARVAASGAFAARSGGRGPGAAPPP